MYLGSRFWEFGAAAEEQRLNIAVGPRQGGIAEWPSGEIHRVDNGCGAVV
jgi:hypothetical protein